MPLASLGGMKRYVALLALAALLGCGPDRFAYAPVQTTSAGVGGSAAIRPFPPASPRGEVRVAALDIADLEPNASSSTLRALHVALVVTNRSDETWSVDVPEQRLSLGNRPGDRVHATTLTLEAPPP